jgi:hypothetical protein
MSMHRTRGKRTASHDTGHAPASFGAGRYVVRRLVGEGSKKRVYLAHDSRLVGWGEQPST